MKISRFFRFSAAGLSMMVMILLSATILHPTLKAQEGDTNEVILILGSDTGVWHGANKTKYSNTFTLDLYSDPQENAYAVMNSAYRESMKDSYGNPMKLTWWMHGGNIFRRAANTNMPLPNNMALYYFKKYHGDAIQELGDEMTMHYHTWIWSDYDGDGTFFWNQASHFSQTREDFDITVAHYLLEEEVFPISFRSGWHYMDNAWQERLDELLPFAMHNAYPSNNTDVEEPRENFMDWSEAPNEYIPYRPSSENYQKKGGNRGWNLLSEYTKSVSQAKMDSIFARSKRGTNRIVCIWSHLPEDDFPQQLKNVHDKAVASAEKYDVPFRYMRAVDGMQRWLKTKDQTEPEITVNETVSGDSLHLEISTNEPIFQEQPVIAVKDVYERYHLLKAEQTGPTSWRSDGIYNRYLAKYAIAVSDSMGNLSMHHHRNYPDDQYVDDEADAAVSSPVSGSWSTEQGHMWGRTAQSAEVSSGTDPKFSWKTTVDNAQEANLYYRVPDISSPVTEAKLLVKVNSQAVDTAKVNPAENPSAWLYLSTVNFGAGDQLELVLSAGDGQNGNKLAADAVKISPLLHDQHLLVDMEHQVVAMGEISRERTHTETITLGNDGKNSLEVSSIQSQTGNIVSDKQEITIPPHERKSFTIEFTPDELGPFADTLLISSNDPLQPVKEIPVSAEVLKYFEMVDNTDTDRYEENGEWKTSVTQAWGNSSRYIFRYDNKGKWARFTNQVDKAGKYAVQYIVPKTENAVSHAWYEISVEGSVVDTVLRNQNLNSGDWVTLGHYHVPENGEMSVRVIVSGKSTNGDVLRADAVKWQLLEEGTSISEELANRPGQIQLAQNYPNPFNPETNIQFYLPTTENVKLTVYNSIGRTVATLVDGRMAGGWHQVPFRAGELSSGVYIYRLQTESRTISRKMILLK